MDNEITGNSCPWYAAKLYSGAQSELEEFLTSQGLECFIPREYVTTVDADGHRHTKLKPVVRNLLFVKKSLPEPDMRKVIQSSPRPMYIFRKSTGSTEYYEIPSVQMEEFRAMCNPDILMRKYISEEEAHLKAGTPVEVFAGPLKGLTGKLVRSNKQYFLLKEVPGMGVMLKVTRWCCRAIEE
ncbi:MAG: UpxY family transcription antiterminator [Prevotella sp.]|nr:UpxY family transcription antiterminator [Prevotella sp.]